MIRFVKYDENLCLNDKIYRMMIVLYDKICKRWQKGILQNLNEIWFLLNLINVIGFTIISLCMGICWIDFHKNLIYFKDFGIWKKQI